MEKRVFEKKTKEEKPVLAICYDFDKTLTPDDMQAQGYIQSVGYNVADFWKESNGLAECNDMDQNLAYMYKMIEKAQGRVLFTRKNLEEYGAKVKLFPGVDEWFERIREYAKLFRLSFRGTRGICNQLPRTIWDRPKFYVNLHCGVE